jgi:hypothetical protein
LQAQRAQGGLVRGDDHNLDGSRVERGEDPMNIVRGGAAKRVIETHAWNTILSREDAARDCNGDTQVPSAAAYCGVPRGAVEGQG